MTLTDETTELDNAEQLTTLGAALRRALDGDFAEERAAARSAFPAANMHMKPGLDMATARQWTLARLHELSASGFGSAGVPQRAGAAADPLAAVVTFEMLAHGDMSVTIKSGVQFGLFGGAVTNLGTAWHHDTFLPDITSMKLLGGFAMTELGHGSDVASIETEIVYDRDSDEFIVNSPKPSAAKAYIGNAAADGTMAAVFGQLTVDGVCHGVHTILVPIRDEDGHDLPGVTTGDQGHKGGLLGVDNGTILFDHVRVPRRMLLDRYGGVDETGTYRSAIADQNKRFFTMLGTLVRGRVCIAAAGGIGARRGLSIAMRHGMNRRQFPAAGRPDGVLLLDYVTYQRRLLPKVAKAYALGFAQNDLTAALVHVQGQGEHTERDQRELETRAAGLKAMTTWFANDAVQEAREACGGAGYMSENRLTGLRQDIDIFATFEGDNTVLMQLVAKGLLTNYAQEWSALDRTGVVQQTTRVVGETLLERTAANLAFERLANSVRRRPEETAVVDKAWHALMFEERARHSLESLARRMRAARKDSGDGFEAFNRLGPHVQFVARAHMEQVTLAAFVEAVSQCEDDAAKEVLENLCGLYALHSIHGDRAWFLEHHRISASRSKALGDQIDALCGQLRPHSLALVEGMGVPSSWLSAPLVEATAHQPDGA
ncbi:acyl-CoA dehydrogenase family protein [Demequina sp. TTPB684]|uniref:acyl-CoA dehydrogenase family protein n=1 Tax=unclassified Demequina TaxID=2620311 RepID=UPI001CF3E63F|nr:MULTISPECIES: acyl-CoA dehydrogenase [unclassified Demequina]MCB2413792.1 acyl-CoA dehydrogenase family protein [Demequina sp. TTPB684]UPU89300.1 acyl-CoA dehydrogenase family protein [Demequina sp. TMPB413]